MNFERIINNFLFKLFSIKNFYPLFGLLLILLLVNILYNNNNLIEGNSHVQNILNKNTRNINNANNNNVETSNIMTKSNNSTSYNIETNSNIYNTTENFIENMSSNNCSGDNISFFNYDSSNTTTTSMAKACRAQQNIRNHI